MLKREKLLCILCTFIAVLPVDAGLAYLYIPQTLLSRGFPLEYL
jgi:hypothetical protein